MTPAAASVDPDEVVAAVTACPDVASMAGGLVSEVACYLPGRRVEGVRISDDGLQVHIVASWGRPLPEVAEEVRQAVQAVAPAVPVLVSIDDIELPPAPAPRRPSDRVLVAGA